MNPRDNPRQLPVDPRVGAARGHCQLLLPPSARTDAPPAWNLLYQGMRKAASESLRKSVILGAIGGTELSGHTSAGVGAAGAWKWRPAAPVVVSTWEGPPLLGWVWGLGPVKDSEGCAAATWRKLPAGKEPVPEASQRGDFWHRWQWRGPAAVQAGESTRTSLRHFHGWRRTGKPCRNPVLGWPLCSRSSQHSLSSQVIFCTGPSMSLAPSGMASGGCWVLLGEVWDGRVSTASTPGYPVNPLVVFPPETRPRSFPWHSSRLALPCSVTRGQRWLIPVPRTTLNTSSSPAECR